MAKHPKFNYPEEFLDDEQFSRIADFLKMSWHTCTVTWEIINPTKGTVCTCKECGALFLFDGADWEEILPNE